MTDSQEIRDDRGSLPVFIHSELDELGLTPEAFRVYCHLIRRASGGQAYPKQQSIADICFPRVQRRDADCARFDKPVGESSRRAMVTKAIEALEEHGLIVQQRRIREDGKNTSSIYSLRPPSEWRSWDQLPKKKLLPRSPGDLGPGSPGDLHKGIPTIEGSPKRERKSDFSQFENPEFGSDPEIQAKPTNCEIVVEDPEQTPPSSAAPSPPAKTRREAPGLVPNSRPYPEMDRAGLGAMWTGADRTGVDRFRSFDPDLIAGTIAHLRKRDLPHERGDAIHCILNAIRNQEWGKLAGWHEAGLPAPANLPPEDDPEEELILPPGWMPPEVRALREGRGV